MSPIFAHHNVMISDTMAYNITLLLGHDVCLILVMYLGLLSSNTYYERYLKRRKMLNKLQNYGDSSSLSSF